MRYENQNPQVTYLLEKIEEQEKEIQRLQKECLLLNQELILHDGLLKDARDSSKYWYECFKKIDNQRVDFNNTPLFKKMFYKFKV